MVEIKEVYCPTCDGEFNIGVHPEGDFVIICECGYRPIEELLYLLGDMPEEVESIVED